MRSRVGRMSALEMVLIVVLCLEGLFLAWCGYRWYQQRLAHGNDSLRVNTALSVARINSSNGADCPVDGSSSQNCVHWNGTEYIGYYDGVANKIVGDKPDGYNQSSEMDIDGKTYTGKPGTMVIQVETGNGEVHLSWVLGRASS
ncbi:hypothetical protein MOZ60_05730 [Stecheria sp. CLA-KB-P133]|uniref:Uncharacterized protein n=1 Tax=Grylomicrobium aquisgranensis TaxID=2926318 RepID=A0AB35U1K1_9FIRM|nr:hypothetical protein [Stecheria sp. CLA-KB-P133]